MKKSKNSVALNRNQKGCLIDFLLKVKSGI